MTPAPLGHALAALVWVAVLYRLPMLRRGPNGGTRRAHWLTLFALALALTVRLPTVYLALDRLTGIPNLALLFEHSLVLIAAWAVQEFLFHLNYPGGQARRGARIHDWLLLGALVAMSCLFALAPVDQEELDFWRRYAETPFVLEYRLVYLAALGAGLANEMRLSWRYAALSSRVTLRVGLRLVATGGLVGLGYVSHEAFYVISRRAGLTYPLDRPELVREVLIAGAIGLTVVGSTMPAWGTRVGIPAMTRWLANYRAYRRLYPLWLALQQADPEIALMPPQSALADALSIRELGFRLCRRVIEIWDGRLALRPYLDPQAEEYARALCHQTGVPDHEAPAQVEAATLAAALWFKKQGWAAAQEAAIPPALGGPGMDTMENEIVFLVKVAHHFEHSPIVRAVLTHLARTAATEARSLEQVTG